MPTILVLDDSPSVRETLALVLGREHQVVTAPTSDRLSGFVPALVILGLPSGRDHRAARDALARLGGTAPLLLLAAPADVDPAGLGVAERRVEFLPKPFDSYVLRARVRALLAAPAAPVPASAPADRYRDFLAHPFLSAESETLARRALATPQVPLLLIGEHGTGAVEIARAIHVLTARHAPFRVVVGRELRAGDLRRQLAPTVSAEPSAGGTVFVEDVHETSVDAQHDLLALVNAHLETPAVRVIASTIEPLDVCAMTGRLHPELFYALTVVPLTLPPLRERAADIPALVERLTARLAARLDLGTVAYRPAAMDRLCQYLWFGNITELESVLTRTLVVHQPRMVEASHLLFFPEDVPASAGSQRAPGLRRPGLLVASPRPAPPQSGTATPRAPAPAPGAEAPAQDIPAVVRAGGGEMAAPNLEVLLGELAHELRNPMVTIKTFAQHLDSVLEDREVRARFTALTSEAVARMDTLLETVLDFARFPAPVVRPTDLRALAERALAERSDDLARKGVRVERNGPGPCVVAADEGQILFALRSLLEGVIRDLVPHEPVRIAARPSGDLELSFRAERSTAERLAALVEDQSPAGGETPPLPFTLAASLVRRNGGTLQIRSGGAGTSIITLTLPVAP